MSRWLVVAALLLWGAASVVLVGTLMVGHTAAMPGPVDRPLTDAGLREVLPADTSVVHVVPADCSCTDGLVRHLFDRQAREGLREHVVFVGAPRPVHRRLEEVGFTLEVWQPEDLSTRLGLSAGPALAVRVAGELMYLGGYFQFPAAVRSLDEQLIDASVAGEAPQTLPLFGCAVSPELRRAVDPLGVGR